LNEVPMGVLDDPILPTPIICNAACGFCQTRGLQVSDPPEMPRGSASPFQERKDQPSDRLVTVGKLVKDETVVGVDVCSRIVDWPTSMLDPGRVTY